VIARIWSPSEIWIWRVATPGKGLGQCKTCLFEAEYRVTSLTPIGLVTIPQCLVCRMRVRLGPVTRPARRLLHPETAKRLAAQTTQDRARVAREFDWHCAHAEDMKSAKRKQRRGLKRIKERANKKPS